MKSFLDIVEIMYNNYQLYVILRIAGFAITLTAALITFSSARHDSNGKILHDKNKQRS
jgi:hypothetical protein